MNSDKQAATLFPDMADGTPEPVNPPFRPELNKLFDHPDSQKARESSPQPAVQARTEPTTDEPENEPVDEWSASQQAQVDEWGITEADSAKIDAIAEGWKDNVTFEAIAYDLQGFMQKYGVTEEQLQAFLEDAGE